MSEDCYTSGNYGSLIKQASRVISEEFDETVSNVTHVGGSNDVFIVEGDVPRVVKFNTFSEHETFAAEVVLHRDLCEYQHLEIPDILEASLNSTGGLSYAVFEYVDGEPPDDDPVSEDIAERIGEEIANFSTVSTDEYGGYGRLSVTGDGETWTEKRLKTSNNAWDKYISEYTEHTLSFPCTHFREYRRPLTEYVQNNLDAIPSYPDRGIVWLDCRPANILVDNDEIVGVLDFERADVGDPRCLAVNTAYLMSRTDDEQVNERIREAVYRGFGRDIPEPVESVYLGVAIARELRAFEFWFSQFEEPFVSKHLSRVEETVRNLICG